MQDRSDNKDKERRKEPCKQQPPPSSKKKHHDDDKHRHHEGIRDALLESALDRRMEELEQLNCAFEEMLEGKKPFDPPTWLSIS
ncbi:hypothetical protein BGZ98_001845, partial [Dissophora globulifera]